jgi:methylphosphotriester-DNA--protein-cysteine methyltransferase
MIAIPKREGFGFSKEDPLVELLEQNLEYIPNVGAWADEACISYSWMKRQLKQRYRLTPKQIMRQARYEKILLLIEEYGWDAGSQCIAIESGVGKTSDSLYKFLNRHYGTTFSKLREEVLTGERPVRILWLKAKVLKTATNM